MKRKPPRSYDNIDGDQDLVMGPKDWYWGNDEGWTPPPDGDWRDPGGPPQPGRRTGGGGGARGKGMAGYLRNIFTLAPKSH